MVVSRQDVVRDQIQSVTAHARLRGMVYISEHLSGLCFVAPCYSARQRKAASAMKPWISHRIETGRLAVILIGLFTLAMGIILSSIPWADYLILKNLRLWNGTISYKYWQKPGVVRLTKIYIFNVTNPEGFLNNSEKPKLMEVGPFVYREDMEKVNIKFHDNGTVTFQHKKILQFVPELSADPKTKVTVPNIPLLTLTSKSTILPRLLQITLSFLLPNHQPFVTLTPEELLFGYDDTLVSIANQFFPVHLRPNEKMGLLLGRNGTLNEVSNIFTGHTSMKDFGLLDRLNGLDRLPYWSEPPCNDIRASEGSFFPPRDYTHEDIVHVYDKDLCRILPLQYQSTMEKDGIKVGYYRPPEDVFELPDKNPDNKCYCPDRVCKCPPRGLQNISPCQFAAPVYLSFPHFYNADPSLLEAVEGLNPSKEEHETYFKIQPKLGVPLEGKVKVQLNLKVEHAFGIRCVRNFRDIMFPIIWVEEGVSELTPSIRRLVYIATTLAETAVPVINYTCVVVGSLILIVTFIRAYKNVVFTRETLEKGKATLRRGSSFIINGQHRLLIIRDSYTLLNNISSEPDPDPDQEPDV